MNIISVEKVSKYYENYCALNEVSMQVSENEIFGMLGPNGAGKTSLIRIINQITAPDSGKLYYNSEPLTRNHLQDFGYLPEERGLYKKMKVGEQALYLSQLKGLSKNDSEKKLRYWFQKFEIEPWFNKKVEDLSKGMQQKIQFIITVMHQPKVLILDEPFSGFDPINATLIRDEILELKKNGTTIILSTHSMASVEELCDSIALINKSEVVLSGKVKEIRKKNSTNSYDIEFKGNIMQFSNSVWGGFTLQEHFQKDEHIVARVQLNDGVKINTLLSHFINEVEIHSLNEVIPSMNDIFITAVQKNKQEVVAGFTE
jgi:ABC-2 type transport system ATP-binding protein